MVDGKAETLIPDASSSIHNPQSSIHNPQVMAPAVDEDDETMIRWVPLWSAEAVVGVSSSVRGEEAGSRIEDRGSTMADGETDEPWSRSASPIHNSQSIIFDPTSSLPDPRSTISDPLSSIAARALRAARGWADDELVVMYSGNMGLGHRFGEILAAAKILKEESPTGRDANVLALPPPRFVFFGNGKRRAEVEMFIRENPGCAVELHDYTPAENLANHLRSADVHLASLDAAWTGTMVPSKVQGIFAAGRPMIFIGCADSSIGRWVHESGGGWVVAPGDVGGLLAALAAAGDPAVRSAMGQAARSFANEHFDKATNIARIAAVLAGG
jgi:glycosyltransferase involved in cell wall biosynthesis